MRAVFVCLLALFCLIALVAAVNVQVDVNVENSLHHLKHGRQHHNQEHNEISPIVEPVNEEQPSEPEPQPEEPEQPSEEPEQGNEIVGGGNSNAKCTINSASLNLVKRFEGFVGHVYYDSVGVRTIGYGCTTACEHMTSITEPKAAKLLSEMLQNSYGACVRSHVKHLLTENQYGALTSFVYNLGCGVLEGNLLSHLNSGNFAVAESEMLQYDHAGNQVLAGLRTRRQAEVNLMRQHSAYC